MHKRNRLDGFLVCRSGNIHGDMFQMVNHSRQIGVNGGIVENTCLNFVNVSRGDQMEPQSTMVMQQRRDGELRCQ
jgi:hypothetical protein